MKQPLAEQMTLDEILKFPRREQQPLLRRRRRRHVETARYQRRARVKANLLRGGADTNESVA